MKALITGATSGIGRDMAMLLSRKGYDLILASRNKEKMEQLQRYLPANIKIIVVDLSKKSDCLSLYEQVKHEEIDVLINNAGFGYYGNFWDNSLEDDLEMINLNVQCVHILTKLFLKDFRKRNSGYIMNIASFASFSAGPLMCTYYATKNYVLRMSEGLYEELRREKSNVHVCAVCPGPVETEFNERAGVHGFKIKQQSSLEVAKISLKEMFRRNPVILTSKLLKASYWGEKLMGEKMLMRTAYHFQKQKKGNNL